MTIQKAMEIIYNEGIMSVLVEAGGRLNNSIIQSECADKLIQFIAPKLLCDKDGIPFVYGETRAKIAECNNLEFVSTKFLKKDIMIICKFKH